MKIFLVSWTTGSNTPFSEDWTLEERIVLAEDEKQAQELLENALKFEEVQPDNRPTIEEILDPKVYRVSTVRTGDYKMKQYTEGEIQEEFEKIDKMTREEMANLWRFAPIGHKYFNSNLPFVEHFEKRFKELGGMTPEISKEIGWNL